MVKIKLYGSEQKMLSIRVPVPSTYWMMLVCGFQTQ